MSFDKKKYAQIVSKDWELEKETSKFRIFIIEKFKKIFYSFTYILDNYMAHETTKEFLKNSHFENMTAGFLQRCQNLLRYFTPEMMHFQA